MNVNQKLMSLGKVMGYPVAPDLYSGKDDKYIVFTYEDERANMYADDLEEYTDVTIQITLYTPASYNYMSDKEKLKKALIKLGFGVSYCNSWLDNAENGIDRVRHTVFVVNDTDYFKMEE